METNKLFFIGIVSSLFPCFSGFTRVYEITRETDVGVQSLAFPNAKLHGSPRTIGNRRIINSNSKLGVNTPTHGGPWARHSPPHPLRSIRKKRESKPPTASASSRQTTPRAPVGTGGRRYSCSGTRAYSTLASVFGDITNHKPPFCPFQTKSYSFVPGSDFRSARPRLLLAQMGQAPITAQEGPPEPPKCWKMPRRNH